MARPHARLLLLLPICLLLVLVSFFSFSSVTAPDFHRSGLTGPIISYHDSFQYLLNSDVCGAENALTAVVVVHSDPRHPELRDAIRRSLPADLLRELGVRRAFMVADASHKLTETDTVVPQEALDAENAQHGDLVMGNFHDSYHNLTYKHIMALDWASTFCPQARKIIKMDDDIVYDIYELLKVIKFIPDTEYLGGNSFSQAVPFRLQSKWRVTYQQWPRLVYPVYLSGWLYIVTQDVARDLVQQSEVVPFFWIDDTYVTGILAEQLSIGIKGLRKMYVTEAECIKFTVRQRFSLEPDGPSAAKVFKPSFVVGPTDKDLEALEAFNRLTRYCASHACHERTRFALCENRF